jgi:hypothetical protein
VRLDKFDRGRRCNHQKSSCAPLVSDACVESTRSTLAFRSHLFSHVSSTCRFDTCLSCLTWSLASCRTCVVSIRLLAHALSCRIDTCSARGEESLLPERQVRQVSNLHVRHEEKGTKSKREPSVESTRGEEGKRAKAREHSRAKCLGSLQNTPPLNQITSNVD